MIWLVAAFLVTALLYASVGFGGGSTYTALLALSGYDYRLLPILALSCNIVVVTGGTIRFARAGAMPWRKALGLSFLAAPLAFLGGLTPVSEGVFLAVLGTCLIVAGLALLLPLAAADQAAPHALARSMGWASMPLGYVSGLVGIGGGIFLAPLLHLTRWAAAREVAATASLFILINSLSGLVGQLAKNGMERFGEAMLAGWPLLLAVVVGGQAGSVLALRFLPTRIIRILTAILTIWVGSRLLLP